MTGLAIFGMAVICLIVCYGTSAFEYDCNGENFPTISIGILTGIIFALIISLMNMGGLLQ